MSEQNQINNICRVCKSPRSYDYHRLFKPCKICGAKKSDQYYQKKKID